MKSIITYVNDEILISEDLSYFEQIPVNESSFIINHGAHIDSIFNKMSQYINYIKSNNIIYESYNNSSNYDINFNTNEQIAAQNFIVTIGYKYGIALMEDVGLINPGEITEAFDWIKKVGDYAKEKGKQIKDGLSNIPSKLSDLYKFLKKIIKEGIKSVKDMVLTLLDLMLKLGCKVDDLATKLKLDRQKAVDELIKKIKELFKSFSKNKSERVNIYENMANMLTDENDVITEAVIKKSKDDDEDDNDDSSNKNWGGILGKALALILVQALAYFAVCVLLPSIVTLIGGPIAGALAECIAKIVWSSGVIFHQIRHELQIHKSGEYKKKYNTTFKKFVHWFFFLANILWAGWKAVSNIIQMSKIIDTLVSGNENLIKGILPSKAVITVTGWLNDGWKAITGHNTSGFDKLQEHVDAVERGILEKISKEVTQKAENHSGLSKEELKDTFEKTNWKNSREAVNTITNNKLSDEAINALKDTDKCTVVANGAFALGKNEWSKKAVEALTSAGYSKNEAIALLSGQAKNLGLNNMNINAGGMVFMEMPGKAMKALAKAGCTTANNVPFACMGADTFDIVKKTITTITKLSVPAIQNSIDWFGGGLYSLPDIFPVIDPKSGEGFRVRLGSKEDKDNFIYEIPEGGVQLKKLSEIESEITNKASSDYVNIIYDDINKQLNDIKDEMKDDKEKQEKLNKGIEQIKKLKSEQEVVIYYGKRVKQEKTNESYISLKDYLINEGKKITNSKVKDSLDSIIDYLCNKTSKSTKLAYLLSKDKKLINDDDFKDLIDSKKKLAKHIVNTPFDKLTSNSDKKLRNLLDDEYKNDNGYDLERYAKDELKKLKEDKVKIAYTAAKKLRTVLTTGKVDSIINNTKDVELKGETLLNAVFVPFAKILVVSSAFGNETITGDASKDNIKIAAMLKEIMSLYRTVSKEKDDEGNNFDVKQEISDQQKAIYKSIINMLQSDKVTNKAINNKDIKVLDFDEPNTNATKKIGDKARKLVEPQNSDDKNNIIQSILKPNNTKDKDSHTETENSQENSDKEVPVLIWHPIFMVGCDLAKANDKGPRKEHYFMKGQYDSLEYIEIEDGMSEKEIEKFLCNELILDGINKTFQSVSDKPCNGKDKKYKINKESSNTGERSDFGNFTNEEITQILNKGEVDTKYLKGSNNSKVTAAETQSEKKKLERDKKKAEDKIKNDKKLKEKIKNSNVLSDKYIKDNEIDVENLSNAMAERRMAKTKKGFWDKLKSYFGFGDDNKIESEIDNLNKYVYNSDDKKTNESLSNYIKYSTIIENNKHSLYEYLKK